MTDINLTGDSGDYHLLTEGVRLSTDVQGATLELGLRAGLGSKTIIDALAEYAPQKTHIAIDPYGHILYEHKEGHKVRLDYTNEMRDICLENMYRYCREKKINFQFYNMTDEDFFCLFKLGVPVYDLNKKLIHWYSFVSYDGPHAVAPLKKEIHFFFTRIKPGACFCFDDVSTTDVYYDHSVIDSYLIKDLHFKLIANTGQKALYQYEG